MKRYTVLFTIIVLLCIAGLSYYIFKPTFYETIVFESINGKEIFNVDVKKGLEIENNLVWEATDTIEASPDSGLLIYLDDEKESYIYFYIANSNNTFRNILDMQQGRDLESVEFNSGKLILKSVKKMINSYQLKDM